MTLKVVGAGVGRTGTESLKVGLERLLGSPCYHMSEVFGHPEHIDRWQAAAVEGTMPDWDDLFEGYGAAVDWPTAAFWREISAAYPDALVVLSTRDADSWFASASGTIFAFPEAATEGDSPDARVLTMAYAVVGNTFTPGFRDESEAIAAFERHNAEVRAGVPADRLLEWRAEDGWEPLCSALGLPVPDEPFPRTNTTEEFRERVARMTGA